MYREAVRACASSEASFSLVFLLFLSRSVVATVPVCFLHWPLQLEAQTKYIITIAICSNFDMPTTLSVEVSESFLTIID
jgi:hypothetical protein